MTSAFCFGNQSNNPLRAAARMPLQLSVMMRMSPAMVVPAGIAGNSWHGYQSAPVPTNIVRAPVALQ
jgi:hypothetical protein